MLHVGNIVYPGFDIMTLSALSVFEYANKNLDQPHYDVRLVPEGGGPIRSSLGLIVQTEPFDVTPFDTIIRGGSSDMPSSPGLLDYLGRAASDCRRAITHWFFADEFRSRYARVRLEESRLFVIDGPCCTSAGMTAKIDLVLTMVQNDSGPHVVKAVSRNLVL